DCCEYDQHDPHVGECVDVQRVNQVIDVKNVATKVENLQDKSEEWNTAEHHVRQIANQRADKESHFRAVFAHLLLRARFQPFAKVVRLFLLVGFENDGLVLRFSEG